MSLPFDGKRLRAYELEFGAGGQRLGCGFMLDDGSLLFVNEAEITSEIEVLMASLGSPTAGLMNRHPHLMGGGADYPEHLLPKKPAPPQ
jgi:hypothetical protein